MLTQSMTWYSPKNSTKRNESHFTSKFFQISFTCNDNDAGVYVKQNFTHYRIANRLGLKSRSRNDTDGRYLVISKKITLQHLANDIYNGGLYSEVYDLILPTDPLPVKQKPTNNNEVRIDCLHTPS